MLFLTSRAHFRRVEINIYDLSARIIRYSLNSIIFWTHHLNSTTCHILHLIIVAYFDYASSQFSDSSTQLDDESKCNYNPNGLP